MQKKLENAFKKQIFSELPNDTLFILRVILNQIERNSRAREEERRDSPYSLVDAKGGYLFQALSKSMGKEICHLWAKPLPLKLGVSTPRSKMPSE